MMKESQRVNVRKYQRGKIFLPSVLIFLFSSANIFAQNSPPTVEITNNQPFPVKIYELKDLPKDGRSALILVGTKETNQLIASVASKIPANLLAAKQFGVRVTDGKNDWLILSGADNTEAERAAMDWTLRFWKYAKDSGVRRVGLSDKELPLEIDPAQLP